MMWIPQHPDWKLCLCKKQCSQATRQTASVLPTNLFSPCDYSFSWEKIEEITHLSSPRLKLVLNEAALPWILRGSYGMSRRSPLSSFENNAMLIPKSSEHEVSECAKVISPLSSAPSTSSPSSAFGLGTSFLQSPAATSNVGSFLSPQPSAGEIENGGARKGHDLT